MTTQPGPIVRPFAAWLQDQRQGGLHTELTDQLAALVQAVDTHGRAGTLTLTVKVSPAGRGMDGCVIVADSVRVKAPEPARAESIFFIAEGGVLVRDSPRQPSLLLRDVSDPDQSQPAHREAR